MPEAFVAPYTLACTSIEPRPYKYTIRAVSKDSVMLTSSAGVQSFPISLNTSFEFKSLREVLAFILAKSSVNDVVTEEDVIFDSKAFDVVRSIMK